MGRPLTRAETTTSRGHSDGFGVVPENNPTIFRGYICLESYLYTFMVRAQTTRPTFTVVCHVGGLTHGTRSVVVTRVVVAE
jgi:hypothetical protein